MSESTIVREVAQKAARRITRKVIAALQQMTDTLSGDDSELKTTWDEICAQVQHENSSNWDAYDETVRGIVKAHIARLSKQEKEAIWLQTEAGTDWAYEEEENRESQPVSDEEIMDWLVEERVYAEAANWSNARIRAYLDRSSVED